MKFFDQKLLAYSFIPAMLMVCIEVSPWMAAFSLAVLVWRWGIDKKSWRALPFKITGAMSVLLLLQVLWEFRTIIGQEASFHFLLGLASLKVMDFKDSRDHKFLVLLGFILVAVKALFNIDIYWLVPSMFSLVGLWYSLFPSYVPQKNRMLLKVIGVSFPLLIVLFLAFPRISVPWMLPRSPNAGQIGFTNQMNPGSIASIALRPGVAFRAKLSGLPYKKIGDFYWRGVVLNNSQGLSWRLGTPLPPSEQNKSVTSQGEYEVALEPTEHNYLFVLPGTYAVELASDSVAASEGGAFRTPRPLNKSAFYRGLWNQNYVVNFEEHERYLRYPALQPRVQAWVDQVLSSTSTQGERIVKLKELFGDSRFAYTLSPGIYKENDLETFLFERRLGFCEHFAGSYATLARALKIPARVVLGYQGGFYNPLGDFWKISQRDAHAWVEIAQDGKWVSVDPTRWIAPLRFVMGGESFFNLSEEDQKAFSQNVNWTANKDKWEWIEEIGFRFEDLNYRWNYFLLDFDRSFQVSLLQDFLQNPVFFVLPLILGIFLMIYLLRSLLRMPGSKISDVALLLKAIEAWGAKNGCVRSVSQTPMEYFAELSERFPQMQAEILKISAFYDQSLYRDDQMNGEEYKNLSKQWTRAIRKTSAT